MSSNLLFPHREAGPLIPVLVLNLPRDAERHRWMDAHLRSLGIPYILIHGIDGRAIREHEAAPHMARFRKAHGRDMTCGELGCALAHLRLIRRIAMGPDPFVCVLEDDIEISPHAKAFLKEGTLRSLPSFDVLRLYSNDHRQRKPAWRIATMNERSIVAPLRTGWGMYAQVYTRVGVQKIADQQIRAPIDGMIHYDCPPLGLRILEVRPSLVCLRDFGSSTVGWQKPRGIARTIFALKWSLRSRLHFVATWGLRGIIGLIRSRYRRPRAGGAQSGYATDAVQRTRIANARAGLEQLRSANFLIKQAIRRHRHFKKLNATGRDLVIYCGRTKHQWGPDQSGGFGSEEAIINLARALKKFGWQITVYNNCGHDPVFDEGVVYRPFWEFSPSDKQDVVILWRSPKPLDLAINANKIFLDLHDVTDPREFSSARLSKIDRVFVKSKFHRSVYAGLPDDKFAIIPNGLDLPLLEGSASRDPNLLINTSAPERSLNVLPCLFKEVRKRVPAARLQWAYGWNLFSLGRAKDAVAMRWMERTQKELDAAGIESLGHLNHTEIGKLYQQAAVLAYPSEFAETDCLSVKKAQAAGCVPVATDVGALRESIQFGIKIPSSASWDRRTSSKRLHYGIQDNNAQEAWINAVVNLLTNQSRRGELSRAGVAWARRFAWQEIGERWNAVLRGACSD